MLVDDPVGFNDTSRVVSVEVQACVSGGIVETLFEIDEIAVVGKLRLIVDVIADP